MDKKKYWIWFVLVFGVANSRIWDVIHACGDAKQGYARIKSGELRLTPGEESNVKKTHLESANEIIKICEEKNIDIYTYDDTGYPAQLRSIYNPPAVLFCSGTLEGCDDELSITVVGTRHPSQYGADAASKISAELVRSGFTIVSGFADGIDSAAHRAAIKENGRTLAVLGCGIDIEYPKVNSDIREAVIKNGAFLSEFLPGTVPIGRNFPIRNRILSGLSLGVFVVEAPYGSGALITADMAVEQGRDVFCLPPADVFSKSYQGVIKYIRDGAIPVFSHLDIIYEYYTTFSHKLSSLKPENEYISSVDDSAVFSGKTVIVSESKKAPEKSERNFDELSDIQREIIGFFHDEKAHLDDIAAESGFDISVLLTELTDLEISGVIKSLPGKIYELC